MKYFAVVGKPILFSKSPEIFNTFFREKNISAKYTRLLADTAEKAVELFKDLDLSGMSVTAPFKTDIIPFLDEIDSRSKAIGSVNTVVKKDGKLIGYNTDYDGILNTIREFKNKNILLLGAGGASRAVIYTVLEQGGKLTIYNRTKSKLEQLAQEFNIEICSEEKLANTVGESDIIINTIPNGVQLIDDSLFKKEHIIFDAIYHQSVYKHLEDKLNLSFYDGKQWLVNQAIGAFNLFFENDKLERDTINISFPKPKEKIIFTGFMGSGKSLIGEQVAQLLNTKFFSTDNIVSQKESCSINEIFEKYGESYFRKSEQDVLNMLASMNGPAIVSSGGGMVLDSKNRQVISDSYISVWLYASPETIMQRAKPDNRPLLQDNFNLDFIQKLMAERKEYYFTSADIIINTNAKTPKEIVKLLFHELSLLNNENS